MRGQVTWRIAPIFGLLALLLLACLTYCVPSEEVRQARSNTLDEVIGEAELLVPAERKAVNSVLSPYGRWLLVGFNYSRDWQLFDLVSNVEESVALHCSEDQISWKMRWIGEQQFIAISTLRKCYNLVNAYDMQVLELPVVTEDPARLGRAEQVYLLPILGGTAHAAIGLGTDSFVMHLDGPGSDPPPWAAAIPHIEVSQQLGYGGLQRVPSHSGQCYAIARSTPSGVQIYPTDSDTLLARAFKSGWNHSILGWAHDDSGVYFRLTIEGTDAAVFYPWEVIWKLKVPEGACETGD